MWYLLTPPTSDSDQHQPKPSTMTKANGVTVTPPPPPPPCPPSWHPPLFLVPPSILLQVHPSQLQPPPQIPVPFPSRPITLRETVAPPASTKLKRLTSTSTIHAFDRHPATPAAGAVVAQAAWILMLHDRHGLLHHDDDDDCHALRNATTTSRCMHESRPPPCAVTTEFLYSHLVPTSTPIHSVKADTRAPRSYPTTTPNLMSRMPTNSTNADNRSSSDGTELAVARITHEGNWGEEGGESV
ncbi:hypothetical protein ONZ45_g4483 [Pleurotus djamor]|nr:hypothetical protein ONZ45_g4483 [Pleurotus djamor]